MINYGKQSINQDDVDAVFNVLKSDFLTQGPKVAEFENDLSNYCKVKHVKVVNSGTAALHLAYLAIGLEQDDIVWTAPNTFVATANAALYCGATVDFVDIDSKTYNISIDCLKKKLIEAKKDSRLPKLVVPVHFAGQSCEMKDIWKLSKEYGFKIIEDASHALGGEYLDQKIGCCEYSDMAVFSFHPVKMITTGEGGAITTNDMQLNEKIELLRSHGITKDVTKFNNKSDGDWYYEQQELGYNYRLTDIQAALGISQLKRLDSFVEKRREISNKYFNTLESNILPYQHPDTKSSWHLFIIKSSNRKETYKKLKDHSIITQVHYIPVHTQPFYKKNTLQNSNSIEFYQHCLSLPIYVDLSISDQDKVISCI
ncbi:UDP-4-amino-4,6-dideoxy-N-acetyl-beta-L-altrosamine transaminase [Alphaproteobacteria bacterium]|nr:UDP-4-amino-4,6-dideoxy-N-acetyl-beta-L-altrosamine transaminase [Alphaproteobacteria bacterium]